MAQNYFQLGAALPPDKKEVSLRPEYYKAFCLKFPKHIRRGRPIAKWKAVKKNHDRNKTNEEK